MPLLCGRRRSIGLGSVMELARVGRSCCRTSYRANDIAIAVLGSHCSGECCTKKRQGASVQWTSGGRVVFQLGGVGYKGNAFGELWACASWQGVHPFIHMPRLMLRADIKQSINTFIASCLTSDHKNVIAMLSSKESLRPSHHRSSISLTISFPCQYPHTPVLDNGPQ